MEIQVGEYIRTKDGIKKIVKINEGKLSTYYGKYIVSPEYKNSKSINVKNIIKPSFNIIDLIEEGDYANGFKVISIGLNYSTTDIKKFLIVDCKRNINVLCEKDIKSIVTKEQVKSMEYEVKWNDIKRIKRKNWQNVWKIW